MATWYHEPEPFRYRVGAFVQAARGVTFMLQKEKSVFDDFRFYDEWVEAAKKDPVFRWLQDARTDFVHRQALEPASWLELRCIDNPRVTDPEEDHPLRFQANPFRCTHMYMRGPNTDHGHQYERHWSLDGLKGRELLDVCADVFDRLDDLSRIAHERAGARVTSDWKPDPKRALPCMVDTTKYRVVVTSVRDGREVWLDEPRDLHNHGV